MNGVIAPSHIDLIIDLIIDLMTNISAMNKATTRAETLRYVHDVRGEFKGNSI